MSILGMTHWQIITTLFVQLSSGNLASDCRSNATSPLFPSVRLQTCTESRRSKWRRTKAPFSSHDAGVADKDQLRYRIRVREDRAMRTIVLCVLIVLGTAIATGCESPPSVRPNEAEPVRYSWGIK